MNLSSLLRHSEISTSTLPGKVAVLELTVHPSHSSFLCPNQSHQRRKRRNRIAENSYSMNIRNFQDRAHSVSCDYY